jgi:hypothetical protein
LLKVGLNSIKQKTQYMKGSYRQAFIKSDGQVGHRSLVEEK